MNTNPVTTWSFGTVAWHFGTPIQPFRTGMFSFRVLPRPSLLRSARNRISVSLLMANHILFTGIPNSITKWRSNNHTCMLLSQIVIIIPNSDSVLHSMLLALLLIFCAISRFYRHSADPHINDQIFLDRFDIRMLVEPVCLWEIVRLWDLIRLWDLASMSTPLMNLLLSWYAVLSKSFIPTREVLWITLSYLVNQKVPLPHLLFVARPKSK